MNQTNNVSSNDFLNIEGSDNYFKAVQAIWNGESAYHMEAAQNARNASSSLYYLKVQTDKEKGELLAQIRKLQQECERHRTNHVRLENDASDFSFRLGRLEEEAKRLHAGYLHECNKHNKATRFIQELQEKRHKQAERIKDLRETNNNLAVKLETANENIEELTNNLEAANNEIGHLRKDIRQLKQAALLGEFTDEVEDVRKVAQRLLNPHSLLEVNDVATLAKFIVSLTEKIK